VPAHARAPARPGAARIRPRQVERVEHAPVHAVAADTGKLTYQRGSIIQVPAPICMVFGAMVVP
jgi:hypothetical protein